jgi:hypothetical protein
VGPAEATTALWYTYYGCRWFMKPDTEASTAATRRPGSPCRGPSLHAAGVRGVQAQRKVTRTGWHRRGDGQFTFTPVFPATVSHLPVALPGLPHHTIAYRPGNLSAVLTGHHRRAHPEAPGLPFRQPWLAGLVEAATTRYLCYGHGEGVMLVHSATAPNAILRTLPALDAELWPPSVAAAWAAAAALTAIYAPRRPR